ncbi:MAG: glycosyltransferase [Chloroflexi bacterium]|nr:glycosyltransferase [Chloroflexota bacterium]
MSDRVQQRDVMTRRDKAAFTTLVIVYIASVLYYALWWFEPQHIARNWPNLGTLGLALDTAVFFALSFVIWRGVIQNLFTYWVVSTMKAPVYLPPQRGLKVAMITCFVPGKEPYGMLEKTLEAMTRVKYSHDTWVLDEGDDPTVKAICRRLGVKHFSRKGIPEYNQPTGKFKARTKAGNHNAWHDRHGDEYEIVAQMDVDYIPKLDFLERTLGYFRDPKVAFVGSPQIYGNQSESWIARGAAEQAFIFYGPMQKGLFGKGMQLFIGANHVIRSAALRDIDGYSGHIVEDHLTGMRIYTKGWKSVYVPEILCVGEGPPDMPAYLSQQMRWSYGLLDILFRHTPRLFGRLRWAHRFGYVFLQLFYFFGLAQLTGVILTTAYLLLGMTAASMGFTEWIIHATPPFLINIAVFRWLQKFNIDPETENGQGVRGILLMFAAWPIYALASFYVFLGRKLTYAVTPKGSVRSGGPNRPRLRGFIPHFVCLAISLIGLVLFPITGFVWPPLIFWASLNLTAMFGVLAATWLPLLPTPASAPARYRPLGFPVALGSAATAMVLFVAVNVPGMLSAADITLPNPNVVAATRSIKVVPRAEASFLEPGPSQVAIGSLTNSDELQSISKISHVFVTWRPEDLRSMASAVQKAAENNQVAMISWEPRLANRPDSSPTRSDRSILQRIARGDFDSYVADVAKILKSTQQPTILRFAHEMDLPDDGLHPWSFQEPGVYIAAYRHIYDLFREQQVDNVLWLWSPGGRYDTVTGQFTSLNWYPGDSYVDMVGLSLFVYWQWEEREVRNKQNHSYRMPEDALAPPYDEVKKLGKPIVLAEVGVDLHPSRQSERRFWLLSLLDLVKQERYASIVAVVFYNARHPAGDYDADWRLNSREMGPVISAIKADDFFEVGSAPVEKGFTWPWD